MASLPTRGAPRAQLPAATGVVAALLAASCCLLPLALIATGLAGLMMTMMRWEWLTLPLGVGGLSLRFVLPRAAPLRRRAAGWSASARPGSHWASPRPSSRWPIS